MGTYKSNSKAQLTEHFNASEFRCKCGGSHDTLIESALAEKLEKLRTALKCSQIVITSGYRCTARDKAVGGNGYGYHTKGAAADIICYDGDGKKISSKIVSCAAQDVGFGGIANIDSTYTATHVDVRSSNYWKGDETVSTAYSVCSDFYSYYKLTRADVYGEPQTHAVTLTIDGKTYEGDLILKE